MQGIFLEYGITVDDDADGVRNGGFGSTGKQKIKENREHDFFRKSCSFFCRLTYDKVRNLKRRQNYERQSERIYHVKSISPWYDICSYAGIPENL